MERGDRLPLLARRSAGVHARTAGAALVAVAALAAGLGAASRADAAVFMTRGEALALAFPGARVEERSYVLTERQAGDVQRLARVRPGTRVRTAYLGWRGDSLMGCAFFERRTVRTMPGVFLIVVAPDTTVRRVEVVAFDEPDDYLPPARWLDRLEEHALDDRLWPGRDIRNLSGATLSTRAVSESVRACLALYQAVVAPDLAARKAR